MCNNIHKEHVVPEQTSGFGWKIFELNNKSKLTGMMGNNIYMGINDSHVEDKDWAVWIERNYLFIDNERYGVGFCVLQTKADGMRLLERWKKNDRIGRSGCVLRKVEYKGALAIQDEWNIFGPSEECFKTIIVKQFRPAAGW